MLDRSDGLRVVPASRSRLAPQAWRERGGSWLPFGVRVCEDADGPPVVRVQGEVDVLTGPWLAALLDAVPFDDVVVDVGGVSLMCAAGLGVLAVAADRRARRGGSLRVAGASGLVERCLAITGLQVLLAPA